MLRLIYNGTLLDINPEQSMVLSFQGADLTQLGVRSDAFSETWELPATANNRAALGIIDDFNGSLDAAYTTVPCNVYSDNTLILIGFARVVGTDVNVIRLELTGAIGGFVDAIGSQLTTQLELGIFESWDNAQLNSFIWNTGALVAYALCDNGYLANLQTQGTNNTLCEGFRPWFNYAMLIERIFESYDYQVTLPQGQVFDRVHITGGMRHNDQNFIDNGLTEMLLPATSYGTGTNTRITPTVVKQGFWNDTTKEYDYYGNSNQLGVYPGACYVDIEISFSFNVSGPSLQTDPAKFWIESNSGLVYTEYNFPLLTTTSFTGLVTRKFTLWVGAYDQLYFRVETNGSTSMTIGGSDPKLNYLRIIPVDLNPPLSNITARCLPELLVNDLLADFCNRFGLLVSINEATRQVVFRQLNRLNLEAQADWSDKLASPLNSIFPNQYRSEFTYGNLALNNWFRNRNGIGDGKLTSSINGADVEADAFTSQVEMGVSSTIHQGVLPTQAYYTVEQTSGDISPYFTGGNYPFSRTAVYDGMLFYSLRDGTKFLPPRGGRTSAINVNTGWENAWFGGVYKFRYDGFTCAWFEDAELSEDQYPSGLEVLWPLGNTTTISSYHFPNFERVYWQPLLDEYQDVVQRIIARPRIDKVLIKLTPADVSNFDFSRPVTINGIRYYVNLIDQYDAVSNQPTVVELLRIS